MSQQTVQKPQAKKSAQPDVPPPPPDLEVYAEAGDPVEWYESASESTPATVGLVTAVGQNGVVTVNVFHPDLRDSIPMDGCRHMGDPLAKDGRDATGGGWRHKPLTVILRRLALAQGWLEWKGNKLVPRAGGVPTAPVEPSVPVS